MAHRTEGWCSPTLTHNTRRSRGGGGSLERAKLLSQCTACLAATMACVISQVRTIVSRGGTNARAARSAPGGARPSRVPPPCRPAYRRPLREDISRCRREPTRVSPRSPAESADQSESWSESCADRAQPAPLAQHPTLLGTATHIMLCFASHVDRLTCASSDGPPALVAHSPVGGLLSRFRPGETQSRRGTHSSDSVHSANPEECGAGVTHPRTLPTRCAFR